MYVHSHIAEFFKGELLLSLRHRALSQGNSWPSIEFLYFCPHESLKALLVNRIRDYHHCVLLLVLLQIFTLSANIKVFTFHAHVTNSFERLLARPTNDAHVIRLSLEYLRFPLAFILCLP